MPKLFMDGMLVAGDAAGLSVNNGFVVRGMDLALGSGMAAAEAVIEAKGRNDYSAASLSAYQKKMEASFVMKDMRTYDGAPHFMKNSRMYENYPELLVKLMTGIYTAESLPKDHILAEAMRSLKESHVSLFDLAKDGLGARAL